MICDDCTKKEVCRFTEEAKCYEETVKTIIQDNEALFSTAIQCKHKNTGTAIRNPISPNYPQKPYYPYTPNTLTRTITYGESGGDFRDNVNRESQSEYFGK